MWLIYLSNFKNLRPNLKQGHCTSFTKSSKALFVYFLIKGLFSRPSNLNIELIH